MPKHGGKRVVLVKGAERAMEAFKMEVAIDLGLGHLIEEDGSFHNFTTVQVGQIGGEMVRRIQAAGEYAIKQRYDQHAPRLMPEEVLPAARSVRNVTNNGNQALSAGGSASHLNSMDFTEQSQPGGLSALTRPLDNTEVKH